MKIKDIYKKIRDGIIISDIELQREIVYDIDKQKLVIDSIVKGIPLPAFYLWENNKNKLEVLDGKQRIEAIKNFIENQIQYESITWRETDPKIQKKINDTDLSVIICRGEENLKREIFRRINTLGVALSKYEVLNGLFHGEYLRGLTRYTKQDKDVGKVLKSNSRGNNQYKILQLLMDLNNKPKDMLSINKYVNENKKKAFENDQIKINKHMKFVRQIFDNYREIDIYFSLSKKYIKDLSIWRLKKDTINKRIQSYLKSDDAKLTQKSKEIEDIIQTVVKNISVDQKRLFSRDDKEKLLKKKMNQNDKYNCETCDQLFFKEELTVDHKKAWSKGGRTELSNAELLCRSCNSKKGAND